MNYITIYHAVHFEEWNPDTPDTRGIGQSETAQCELARRLAKRGWDVVSYAPVPWRGLQHHYGASWGHLDDADFTRPGHWLLFRRPEDLDHFPLNHPKQKLHIVAQDESFGNRWTDERIAKLDTLFALCESHKRSLESDHPALKGKVKVAANGIKMELIRDAESAAQLLNTAVADGVMKPEFALARDPHRIMWASSPDRGLLRLLKIFKRLREWIPDASLYVAYGWDNIDKLVAMGPQFAWMQRAKDEIMKDADQPGVHWLGRIPQPILMREWLKTGLIVYPTTFRETFASAHCEAMALGAIPVVSPVWAIGEHALAGSLIPGDPADPLIQSRFVTECVRWMTLTEQADRVRRVMMEEARLAFSWERAVDKYEAHLLGYDAPNRMIHSQFAFQVKHALPYRTDCSELSNILNVGCADDPADLAALGATNVDSRKEDPIFHKPTKAHFVVDVRDIESIGWRHECVVCGDMLEHFPVEAVPDILRKLKGCLAPGGKLILTIPDDHRPVSAQHAGSDGSHEYSDGVSAVHTHPIPRPMLDKWLEEAGLEVEFYQELDCHHYRSHGVLAVAKEGQL